MDPDGLTRQSSFAVNGQIFALLSVDGRLRIWDTSSGKLIQEFSPALHVESSCTCLCWTREVSRGGKAKNKEPPRKKKRKVDAKTEEINELGYPSLVLGTKFGDIFSYDPVAGDLGSKFNNVHTSRVNDIAYSRDDLLYSCSDDKFIVEWNYKDIEFKSKWKADKIGVKRICLGPSGKTLLSAGRSIKLWNLETKELLQRFHGHASTVSLLLFSPFSLPKNANPTLDDGFYFLSGSCEDRLVNAWHINSEKPEKTAIASYMLTDVPVFMDSLLIPEDDRPVKLCAGSHDGKIHFFEGTLNGKTNRPIESSKSLQVRIKEGKKSNAIPASFINACLQNDDGMMTLMLASGNNLKPIFQKFNYSKLDKTNKIVQEVSKHMLINELAIDDLTTTELARQNTRTKVIGNSSYVPIQQTGASVPVQTGIKLDLNGNEEDRSNTLSAGHLVSMEERLKNLTPAPKSSVKIKSSSSTPSAGSFSQMLIQGLHSGDEVLLNDILFKSYTENVLRSTIKRIPNTLVGNLLAIVVDKLHQNPARSKDLSLWLRIIMAVHLTFLMTNEHLASTLSNLYRLLKAQQDVHPQLMNLQGKIDLLFSHASNIKAGSSEDDEIGTATVVFNDDSEDETEEMFGRFVESEDEKVADAEESDDEPEDLINENEASDDEGLEGDASGEDSHDDSNSENEDAGDSDQY